MMVGVHWSPMGWEGRLADWELFGGVAQEVLWVKFF